MNWKFWKKPQTETNTNAVEKLPPPKEIPETVGRHLIVKMQKDPDWVWGLKAVIRRRKPEVKTEFDFRVFSERNVFSKGIKVRNYNSLDEHPEFILFSGWFDKRSLQVHVDTKEGPETTAKAA